jgi:hypothetical protein
MNSILCNLQSALDPILRKNGRLQFNLSIGGIVKDVLIQKLASKYQ